MYKCEKMVSIAVDNARLAGRGSNVERATPHKLALCVLIKLYVSSEEDCPLSPTQVRELQLLLVQAVRRVDSIIEPVLVETCKEIERGISDGYLVGDYLRSVLEHIESPDDLFDLLEELRDILVPANAETTAMGVEQSGKPTHIEASCVFGVFLRRVLLSCKRSFEALSRLFHDLSLYINATNSGVSIPGITPRAKPYSLKRKMSFEEEEEDSADSCSNSSSGYYPETANQHHSLKQQAAAAAASSSSSTTASSSNSCSPAPNSPPPLNIDKSDSTDKKGGRMFRSFVSRRQLQYHLHCMVEELESKIGIVSPKQVENQVSEMLTVSPDLPRAHFVRYLNCLMHREYQGAVDSLHTYFDYCMRSGGPTSSAAIATASAAAVAASGGRGTHGSASIHASMTLGRRRPMMQYAVLNLAALHFQFGHRREAMLAIQETVRVAQQNGDHVCVVFALAWLFRLSSSSGGQETSQLLRRCLNRAKELGLDHVQGLSHLVTSQYRLVAPSSIPTAMPPPIQGFNAFSASTKYVPACAVWQSLERGVGASSGSLGSYVDAVTTAMGVGPAGAARGNIHNRNPNAQQQDELYATGMPDSASRAAMSQAIKAVQASLATPSSHLSNCTTIAGRSLLVQSVGWETYGHASLSWLSSLTHLNYFSGKNGTAAIDTCLGICRLAIAQATLGTLGHLCPPPKEELMKEDNDNAFIGALLLLLQAKKIYRYKANNIIVQTFVSLLQKRAIARGNTLESLLLGSTLRSLSPSQQSVFGIGGSSFGEDLHVNTITQWVDGLRTMGRLREAHALSHMLINKCTDISLHAIQENMDLTLSQIFLDSGCSAVAGLPYTLRCISRTEKNGQETIYHSAAIKLASNQLRMGHVHRAFQLLFPALPHIDAHGPLELRGEIHLLLAKCYLRTCCNPDTGDESNLSSQLEALNFAQQQLEKAWYPYAAACRRSETQEVAYLLSLVHNELAELLQSRDPQAAQEHIHGRDQAASKFLQLRQQQVNDDIQITGYLNSDHVLETIACS